MSNRARTAERERWTHSLWCAYQDAMRERDAAAVLYYLGAWRFACADDGEWRPAGKGARALENEVDKVSN